jgi:anti-sigma factor ChrR (cupin superfamily)
VLDAVAQEASGHGQARTRQVWKHWRNQPDAGAMTLLRGADAVWEPTGFAGVEVRRLNVDPAADRVTMLVRMAPGTAYPGHRHGGPEECLVLHGDLLVDGIRMQSGDYQRAAAGTDHGIQSTAAGCVLLIVSSQHDELLDAATN